MTEGREERDWDRDCFGVGTRGIFCITGDGFTVMIHVFGLHGCRFWAWRHGGMGTAKRKRKLDHFHNSDPVKSFSFLLSRVQIHNISEKRNPECDESRKSHPQAPV